MTKQNEYGKYLEVAVECATAAGAIQAERYGTRLDIKHKGEADLVTEVDLKCEETIRAILGKAYPGHAILAEEKGGAKEAPARWIVDPLDGTTNFAHAYPHFCCSVALELEGKIVAGAVYNPMYKELYTATLGGGAFLNGKPIRVSEIATLNDCMMATGFPYNKTERVNFAMTLFARMIEPVQALRRDGSAALNLCYVAAGRFDGFWELLLNPWDIAAGWLIVEEAGGKVTRLTGDKMVVDSRDIVASNGIVHGAFIEALNRKD